MQYTKSVLNHFKGKLSKVIILDSFAHENDLTPPTLRVLQSSISPILKSLTQYEIPHMVTGLPAAVLNHVQKKKKNFIFCIKLILFSVKYILFLVTTC